MDVSQQRIIGVDPGLNVTGYGIIDLVGSEIRVVEAGIIRGTQRDSITARVADIHAGLTSVIEMYSPTVMALEELYSHYARPKTAILMGHARGVICLAAAQAGIPVHHYAATHVKKIITGNGRAPKSQIQLAVQRELRLDEPPTHADVADALAVAMCHGFASKSANNMLGTTVI